LQGYTDLLIQRLSEAKDDYVDICTYLNWTTFDIISDLVFGRPFGCLQDQKTHIYVSTLLKSVKSIQLFYIKNYLSWLTPFTRFFMSDVNLDDFAMMTKYATTETEKRMAMETQRPDFMTAIMKHNTASVDQGGITKDEICSNVRLLLIAGTETTATTLSATVFYLLKNPTCLEKLKAEVRGAFQSSEEITIDAVTRLEYMTAVLHEALRLLPPVPIGAARKVPDCGAVVSGTFIPGMVSPDLSALNVPLFHP